MKSFAKKIASPAQALIAGVALAAGMAMTPVAYAGDISLSSYLKCRSTQLTEFPGNIVEAAVATPELSTLVSLVQAANLVGPLAGKGPLTVFAPTNAAFAKVPAPVLNAIGSDVNLLTAVLTYHVSAEKADPRRNLIPTQVKTLQGQTLYVGFDADGASVNQATAACKGVKTTNGTVWVIDSVLLPQFK